MTPHKRNFGHPDEIPQVPWKLKVWLVREAIYTHLVRTRETWTIEGQIESEIIQRIKRENDNRLKKPFFVQALHYQDSTEFRFISDYNKWQWQDKPDKKYCCIFKADKKLHDWFETWWETPWCVTDICVEFNKQAQTAIITKEK